MSEPDHAESSPGSPLQTDLQQLANLLREASHLDPQTQKSLASLLEELGSELASSSRVSAHQSHLTEVIGDVARSLHEQHPIGLLEAARDRLQEAAARAETDAPVATGVVYRFIEALSSVGI